MSKHHHQAGYMQPDADYIPGNDPARVDLSVGTEGATVDYFDDSADGDTLPSANATFGTEAEAAQTESRKRKVTTFDVDAHIVTITDPVADTSASYDMSKLTVPVLRHLSMVGLVATLRVSKDPEAAYSDMVLGNLPGRASKTPRVTGEKPRDRWRDAVAHYLINQDKIAGRVITDGSYTPLTLENARAIADSYTRQQMAASKNTLGIIKQFAKLAEADGISEDVVAR